MSEMAVAVGDIHGVGGGCAGGTAQLETVGACYENSS
jgi:hypothetical protein